jgi:hypothetical protein
MSCLESHEQCTVGIETFNHTLALSVSWWVFGGRGAEAPPNTHTDTHPRNCNCSVASGSLVCHTPAPSQPPHPTPPHPARRPLPHALTLSYTHALILPLCMIDTAAHTIVGPLSGRTPFPHGGCCLRASPSPPLPQLPWGTRRACTRCHVPHALAHHPAASGTPVDGENRLPAPACVG